MWFAVFVKYSDVIPPVPDSIPRLGNRFSQWLGHTLLYLSGWRVTGNIPNYKKMVIAVGPHTSNWDFVLGISVVFALKLKISFFGKHTLFVPPFDRVLRRWGGIPIERSKAHGVVDQMVGTIASSDKLILALSPEGTRRRIDNWKQGFIHIARQADIPLVLIGLDYHKKQIIFGDDFMPDPESQGDMKRVYAYFRTVTAKYPQNVGFPTGDKN